MATNTEEREAIPRSRKILISAIIIGVLGAIAGVATYSAFSSGTTAAGNVFSGGTVNIGSNDSGSALYSVANQKPGDSVTQCIKVTYSGTLESDVRLFAQDAIGPLGEFLDLTITPGTQASSTFPDCTGFNADGAALFTGTLAGFQDDHDTYDSGVADFPGSESAWTQGDSVVYQFKLTLQDTNEANAGAEEGLSTGSHRFTFEARNQ